jgi:hypothetical protein
MNGGQLFTFLTLDPHAGPLLKGMAMSNSTSLQNIEHTRAMYVLNTDVEKGRGEHWCMLYFDGDLCEFFDPFGMPPGTYGFNKLLQLRRGVRKKIWNRMCMQNIQSKVCGAHCLFYGFHRSRGIQLKEIMGFYDATNLLKNDHMVENFVKAFGESYSVRST